MEREAYLRPMFSLCKDYVKSVCDLYKAFVRPMWDLCEAFVRPFRSCVVLWEACVWPM